MLAMPTRNRIKELLAIRGWSIYELADRTKMSYPQLYRLVKATEIPKGTIPQRIKWSIFVPIGQPCS